MEIIEKLLSLKVKDKLEEAFDLTFRKIRISIDP